MSRFDGCWTLATWIETGCACLHCLQAVHGIFCLSLTLRFNGSITILTKGKTSFPTSLKLSHFRASHSVWMYEFLQAFLYLQNVECRRVRRLVLGKTMNPPHSVSINHRYLQHTEAEWCCRQCLDNKIYLIQKYLLLLNAIAIAYGTIPIIEAGSEVSGNVNTAEHVAHDWSRSHEVDMFKVRTTAFLDEY